MRIMPALNSVGTWVGAGWNTAVLSVSTPLADLWQWLAPDSIGTTDPIETWTDKSINGRDATQATVADRPALIDPLVNGFAGARYDTTDTLNTAAALPLPWTIHTAVALTKPASKQYITGSAGTGGTYVTSAGYVGVDLGGTGVEGTVDRTGSFIPANDSFSASGTDSGVGGIGDIPNARWTEEANGGTIAVTGGKLKMTCPGGAGVKVENVVNAATIGGTGNFTASAAFSNLSLPGGQAVAELRVYSGSDIYIWYRGNSVGDTGQRLRMYKLGSSAGLKYDEVNSTTAGTLRIVRDSATTLRFYLDAALKYTATISSGAAFDVTRLFLRDSQGDEGGTNTVDWDDFTLLDAVGEPITISTGVSPMISVQAVAEAGQATLYVNGIQEATGAIGSGTLPSVNMLAAGLAGDVPESLIYSVAQDESTIQAIAARLAADYQ